MSRAVKLSEMLLTNAGKYANIFSRSIPMNLENKMNILSRFKIKKEPHGSFFTLAKSFLIIYS
ncbi:MAG: hypothetical protein B6I23_03330 [Rickettsiaceae bacterium 4572_127]|nr:MAG: hypothetical protein B6I23_03330 [Rickettsiaceae bacterium 4572_127]